jgi:hypothetical protein
LSTGLGHAGVKDAVLGAVDELCIGDLHPSEAAEKLADLADGSTLGTPPCFFNPFISTLVHSKHKYFHYGTIIPFIKRVEEGKGIWMS